jgi:hypothetical protein
MTDTCSNGVTPAPEPEGLPLEPEKKAEAPYGHGVDETGMFVLHIDTKRVPLWMARGYIDFAKDWLTAVHSRAIKERREQQEKILKPNGIRWPFGRKQG